MKKLALILLLLALVGCTHTISPVCRHNAMYAAVTACETMPVRMARGETETGVMHVEAQVFHEGKWWYVDKVTFKLVNQPNVAFTVCGYETVTDFFDMQFRPFIERFSMENR